MIILSEEQKKIIRSAQDFISVDLSEKLINNFSINMVVHDKREVHFSILKLLSNLTENINILLPKMCFDIFHMIYESLRNEHQLIFERTQEKSDDLYRVSISTLSRIKNNFDIFDVKKKMEVLNKQSDVSLFGHHLFSFTTNRWVGLSISGVLLCITGILRSQKNAEQCVMASSLLFVSSLLFFSGLEGYRHHLNYKLTLLERKQAYVENNILSALNTKETESASFINKGVNYGSV